jgi:hypothetical protein
MTVKEMQQRPPRYQVVEYTGTPESFAEVQEFMGTMLAPGTEQQTDENGVTFFEQVTAMGSIRHEAPIWFIKSPFTTVSPITEELLNASYEDVPASATPVPPLPELVPVQDVVVDPTEDAPATS